MSVPRIADAAPSPLSRALARGTRPVLVVAVAAGLGAPPRVDAQILARPGIRLVGVGTRVRIGVTDRVRRSPLTRRVRRVEGTIRGIAPDTLYLALGTTAGPVAIPRALIQGVEMSLGPPSRRASAVERGALGAVIGALVMSSEWVSRDRRRFRSDAFAATVGAGAGFAVGALIGAVRPYERWRVAWIPE